MPYHRINVVGSSGSGKSTFAKKLAERLQIPHIEMDQLFWGPDWHWPSDEEFLPRVKEAIAGDRWVLDGNYSRTTQLKWAVADTVIWIDLPFITTTRWSTRHSERSEESTNSI